MSSPDTMADGSQAEPTARLMTRDALRLMCSLEFDDQLSWDPALVLDLDALVLGPGADVPASGAGSCPPART